jgi:carboxylesterase type B
VADRFDYVLESQRGSLEDVPHGGEVPYVFGAMDSNWFSPLATTKLAISDQDRAVSVGIIGCWAAFAKHGDPSRTAYCADWKPYSVDRGWFVFSDKPSVKQNLDQEQLDVVDQQPKVPGLRQ